MHEEHTVWLEHEEQRLEQGRQLELLPWGQTCSWPDTATASSQQISKTMATFKCLYILKYRPFFDCYRTWLLSLAGNSSTKTHQRIIHQNTDRNSVRSVKAKRTSRVYSSRVPRTNFWSLCEGRKNPANKLDKILLSLINPQNLTNVQRVNIFNSLMILKAKWKDSPNMLLKISRYYSRLLFF